MLYSTEYIKFSYCAFKMYYIIIQPRTLFPSKVEGQTKTLVLVGTFCYFIGPLII